ncbi:hypothetical protein [Methanoculleus sp.]|jgi:hypothetical protein|uniref:hypothetical protein n=1 Tax=Methanoculleus sp. TaxID=90427 RepID=UPI0025FCCD52|nr:hypothetical protein [Methanoculleus sp.]MCK9319386.1 hypothetical protein [Methanoculleus sp.]
MTPEEQYKKNMVVLKEINNSLPEKYKKKLMKTIINKEQEIAAKELLKNKDLPQSVRDILEKDIKSGSLRFKEEVVNEKITKKIDEYYDKEVKKAIADGRLPSPDEDPFYKKMAEKFDKIKEKYNESKKSND